MDPSSLTEQATREEISPFEVWSCEKIPLVELPRPRHTVPVSLMASEILRADATRTVQLADGMNIDIANDSSYIPDATLGVFSQRSVFTATIVIEGCLSEQLSHVLHKVDGMCLHILRLLTVRVLHFNRPPTNSRSSHH